MNQSSSLQQKRLLPITLPPLVDYPSFSTYVTGEQNASGTSYYLTTQSPLEPEELERSPVLSSTRYSRP